MQKQIILGAIIVIGLIIFLAASWTAQRLGASDIESKINVQLAELMKQDLNLRQIELGSRTRFRMVGNGPSCNGEIQYRAKCSDKYGDVFVYWVGGSTNCRITKIEFSNSSSEPKIFWLNTNN